MNVIKNNFFCKTFPCAEQILTGHRLYNCSALHCLSPRRNRSLTSSLHIKLFHLQIRPDHILREDTLNTWKNIAEHPALLQGPKSFSARRGQELPAANCCCPFHTSLMSHYFFAFLRSYPYILTSSFGARMFWEVPKQRTGDKWATSVLNTCTCPVLISSCLLIICAIHFNINRNLFLFCHRLFLSHKEFRD